MDEPIRPLPFDPAGAEIAEMVDLHSEEWLLTTSGEYGAAAVEVMRSDGSGYERMIALYWPARINHRHDPEANVTVRLLLDLEDAEGLTGVLLHTLRWLDVVKKMSQ